MTKVHKFYHFIAEISHTLNTIQSIFSQDLPDVGMPVQSKPKQDKLHMPGLPVWIEK